MSEQGKGSSLPAIEKTTRAAVTWFTHLSMSSWGHFKLKGTVQGRSDGRWWRSRYSTYIVPSLWPLYRKQKVQSMLGPALPDLTKRITWEVHDK